MKRFYEALIEQHFRENQKMLFLSGPRQAGKTTVCRSAVSAMAGGDSGNWYFNWDDDSVKRLLLEGNDAFANRLGLDSLKEGSGNHLAVFDDINRFPHWRNFLKGMFDVYGRELGIIATGSARLDVYRKGGDSLVGRYLPYRIHPLTLRECCEDSVPDRVIRNPIKQDPEALDSLLRFGGFPEPLVKGSERFHRQWLKTRRNQVFREDIQDLTRIRETAQVDLLALMIEESVGGQINYSSFSKHLRVSVDTIRRWCDVLDSLYVCFFLRPWSTNIPRSLLKEPKAYAWDWSLVADAGKRSENLVASHLLKAVHFWNDHGLGDFSLHFLRDKEKREVDFLIARDRKPWMLVEVKASSKAPLSENLKYFHRITGAPYAFQVVIDAHYVEADCFQKRDNPIKVPARTFLSQLV